MRTDLNTELLGVPPGVRPPSHYELLGLPMFESDPENIHAAVLSQSAELKRWVLDPNPVRARAVQRMLNEVGQASADLEDAARKRDYDTSLGAPPPPVEDEVLFPEEDAVSLDGYLPVPAVTGRKRSRARTLTVVGVALVALGSVVAGIALMTGGGPAQVMLADVVRAQADALDAWEQAQALDHGQGFGAKLDEADQTRRSASELYAQKDVPGALRDAKAAYDNLVKQCEELQGLERERQAAIAAQEAAGTASVAASKAGAEEDANRLWEEAEKLSGHGDSNFNEGVFAQAEVCWAQARAKYVEARRATEAAGAGRAYAKALKEQDVAMLDRYGGEEWAKVKVAADAGDKALAGGEDVRAKEEYQRALALLSPAVRVAQGALRAERQARYDAAMADGQGFVHDGKWQEAQAAYGRALDVPAYGEDIDANAGLEAARLGAAYQAACDKARAAMYANEWQVAVDHCEAAIATGHTDVSAARALLAEAPKYLPPPWAKVSKEQIEAAAKLNLPVAKELDLGGGVKMRFVLIAPGKFMMGSNTGFPEEKPVHEVAITKAFYMGVTEVTQAQWKAVMGTEPWKGQPQAGRTSDSAADDLSWNDATAYLGKLRGKAGGTYRLPTEAEWEYACRAGSAGKYCFGDDGRKLGEYAWYRDNTWSAGKTQPQPAGGKKPNGWGLHDMHGNVEEWCQDRYYRIYYEDSPPADPPGLGRGSYRVRRGGSWGDYPAYCRSANRAKSPPTICYYGFRVVFRVPSSSLMLCSLNSDGGAGGAAPCPPPEPANKRPRASTRQTGEAPVPPYGRGWPAWSRLCGGLRKCF